MEIERSAQTEQKSASYLREQLDLLKVYWDSESYWAIKPEDFPDVLPIVVARMRYIATINQASYLITVRELTSNEDSRGLINGAIINLLRSAETGLATSLNKLDLLQLPDNDFITGHNFFRQGVDQNGSLEFVLRNGLPEQINSKNFPALRALSEREMAELKLRAVGSRLDNLQEQLARFRGTFSLNSIAGHPLRERLEQKIKETKSQYEELLGKSLEK